MKLLDLYLAPATPAAGASDSTARELAGAMTTGSGPADTLVSATIDGTTASVLGTNSGSSIPVTAGAVTDIGFTPSDPQLKVDRAGITPGVIVPVRLTFAQRGAPSTRSRSSCRP